METPKVSISVMAYNQAAYIRQTLDSILMQQTSFPYRAVVHDDASDDGTREIIQSYVAAHPDRISAIYQDENQMGQGRRVFVYLQPELVGAYIAFLDGDDYWTDSTKLQRQADFLDRHPGCAVVQTRCAYTDDATGAKLRSFPPPHRSEPRHSLADLAPGNFIQNSAAMLRSAALPCPMPDGFEMLPFGDYAIFSLAAREGWIGLIEPEMAVYRIHQSNFWAGGPFEDRLQKTQIVRDYITRNLPEQHRRPWLEASGLLKPTLTRRALRRAQRTLLNLPARFSN